MKKRFPGSLKRHPPTGCNKNVTVVNNQKGTVKTRLIH